MRATPKPSALWRTLMVLATALGGCSTLDTVIDTASDAVFGRPPQPAAPSPAVASPVEPRVSLGGALPLQYRQMYVSTVFTSFFYGGGYEVAEANYEPGQWTRWQVSGMDLGSEFEKAYLKKDEAGRTWWRMATLDSRHGTEEETIIEALFSAPDASGEVTVRRMRCLFPGDAEPGEMPVQEDTGAWYREPVRFTPESLEGATQGVEDLTTPAGTFHARHLLYKMAGGSYEWWLTDRVPGGLVKYRIRATGEADAYEVTLKGYGGGATTRLGSY